MFEKRKKNDEWLIELNKLDFKARHLMRLEKGTAEYENKLREFNSAYDTALKEGFLTLKLKEKSQTINPFICRLEELHHKLNQSMADDESNITIIRTDPHNKVQKTITTNANSIIENIAECKKILTRILEKEKKYASTPAKNKKKEIERQTKLATLLEASKELIKEIKDSHLTITRLHDTLSQGDKIEVPVTEKVYEALKMFDDNFHTLEKTIESKSRETVAKNALNTPLSQRFLFSHKTKDSKSPRSTPSSPTEEDDEITDDETEEQRDIRLQKNK